MSWYISTLVFVGGEGAANEQRQKRQGASDESGLSHEYLPSSS
jgi:hypothetical protein